MVSNMLKIIRLERGMSIAELSRRTGLSRMTIYSVENHKSVPSIETAFLISAKLERRIDEIFFIVSANHELQGEGRGA